ncbi:MAG: radical SAM family heme chaperone HemW [Oscillospiraceae bacterium]|jgi:oxygen-independent coproporphyrinogen-3 oxidase|nr:radical SAM family heme chaperone HemW [Oscillospiraceae bacterium]
MEQTDNQRKPLGIYIHIPFCHARCAYCDFYSSTACSAERMNRYAAALRRHITEYSAQLDGYIVDTVYFGGGTPTVFGAERLISVLDRLKRRGHVSLDAEITLEANPESVDVNDLRRLRRAGFNRISIGIQSSKQNHLTTLGRLHNFETAERAVEYAREAGFTNVSVDVMYGLPNQTREDFADDLLRIAALQPDHISCYGLKIEEGTPFYIYNGSPFLPTDDDAADMYLYAVDTLERYGYTQYEISNFARQGRQSLHNLKYWLGDEYLGIGASAHSYIGGTRYAVISDAEQYMQMIETGGGVVESRETIADYELLSEYLMLRLRTTRGVSEDEYKAIYNCGMARVLELLASYEERGWVEHTDERWRFTPEGFLLSNTLIGELLDAQQRERTELVRPQYRTVETDTGQASLFENERRTVASFI